MEQLLVAGQNTQRREQNANCSLQSPSACFFTNTSISWLTTLMANPWVPVELCSLFQGSAPSTVHGFIFLLDGSSSLLGAVGSIPITALYISVSQSQSSHAFEHLHSSFYWGFCWLSLSSQKASMQHTGLGRKRAHERKPQWSLLQGNSLFFFSSFLCSKTTQMHVYTTNKNNN